LKTLFLAISIFLFTATSAFSAGFLYHSDGPYRGKVIDLETGEPIEGAVVAGTWELYILYIKPSFCDAEETITDKNGEFVLPKASCFTLWPLAKMRNLHFIVFKPGYLGYPPLGATFEERKDRMPGITGEEFRDEKQYNIIKLGRPKTRMERELTFGYANSPFGFDEAIDSLPTLIKLVNEEAKNLGLSGEIGPTRSGGQK
jgi:hypothetical protein